MEDKEINEFILVSERETIKEYSDALKAKVDSLDAKNERILLLLLLTVVVYFLIKESLISQVNLGVVG